MAAGFRNDQYAAARPAWLPAAASARVTSGSALGNRASGAATWGDARLSPTALRPRALSPALCEPRCCISGDARTRRQTLHPTHPRPPPASLSLATRAPAPDRDPLLRLAPTAPHRG